MNDYRYPDPDLGRNAVALVLAFCLMAAFVMGCQKYAGEDGGRGGSNQYSRRGEY